MLIFSTGILSWSPHSNFVCYGKKTALNTLVFEFLFTHQLFFLDWSDQNKSPFSHIKIVFSASRDLTNEGVHLISCFV